MATLYGVEADEFAIAPKNAGPVETWGSHPAAPVSPAAEITEIPSAAACWYMLLRKALPSLPANNSQPPMLMLMIGASRSSTMRAMELKNPGVEAVDAEVTNLILALGAIAPAHSMSRSASSSASL